MYTFYKVFVQLIQGYNVVDCIIFSRRSKNGGQETEIIKCVGPAADLILMHDI